MGVRKEMNEQVLKSFWGGQEGTFFHGRNYFHGYGEAHLSQALRGGFIVMHFFSHRHQSQRDFFLFHL